MKANVSIPSPIAQAAVTIHQEDNTEALNQVYDAEPSEMDTKLIKVQVALLDGEKW